MVLFYAYCMCAIICHDLTNNYGNTSSINYYKYVSVLLHNLSHNLSQQLQNFDQSQAQNVALLRHSCVTSASLLRHWYRLAVTVAKRQQTPDFIGFPAAPFLPEGAVFCIVSKKKSYKK